MTQSLAEFRKLTDAEQYFQFFELPYEQQLVNVNRLHILKKFSQLMAEIDANFPNDSDEEKLAKYKDALIDAYNLFITSSGVEQKLFKVFKEKPKNVVLLSDLEAK
ncbi:nitrogenase-stabilizing/protective protein NifW [Aerosakkonemataceae cyanobacterium BLCC-F154]|uniref:Nitrogenase-stabilizing/protective protein NifW n=1 Tax=Floridaenema fluviatile BLCC-F154 TaxID=3153640 RepID=A0ABV4YKD4_9CYAN